MTLVGVIPARGGSKGIPNKNLAPCDGRPLLAYTARAALDSGCLPRVILSTDSERIAEAGRGLGLEVPFLRPEHLAQDATPMIDVLRHLLTWLEGNGPVPDALVLLQPTSPLRGAKHVAEAVAQYERSGAQTVVSMIPVPHQFSPVSVMEQKDGYLSPWLKEQGQPLRRQDKPVLYARNGPAILIVASDLIRAGQLYGASTVGYLMGANDSIDVDGPEDLKLAELVLRARREGVEV